MSAEIATLERVRSAVEQLRRGGRSPTADRVIELIGGGSKSTVLAHLKTIRDVPPESAEIPSAILDICRGALIQVYRAGRAAEAESVRTATERISETLRDQDVQIEELAEQVAILEQERVRLGDEIAKIGADRADAEAAARRLELQVERLNVDLAAERGKVHDALQSTLAKVENLLERAEGQPVKAPPGKTTLSMPSRHRDNRRGEGR